MPELSFDLIKWILGLIGAAITTSVGFMMFIFRWLKADRAQEQAELQELRDARAELEKSLSEQIDKMNLNNEKARKGYRQDMGVLNERLERGNRRMTHIEATLDHIPTSDQVLQISIAIAALKQEIKANQSTVQLIHEYLLNGDKK